MTFFSTCPYGRQALPAAGATMAVIGDSISDPIYGERFHSGEYAQRIANAFGWRMVAQNMVMNPSYELGANATLEIPQDNAFTIGTEFVNSVSCSFANDATHASSGARALKLTPAAANWQFWPIAIGGPNINLTGSMRHGMIAGFPYTFSTDLYVPTGTGSPSLVIADFDGSTVQTTTVAATATRDAWQTVTVSRTLRNTATQAYVYLTSTDGTAAHVLWVDRMQVNYGLTQEQWTDRLYRPATQGTLLSNLTGAALNMEANLTNRLSALGATVPDVILMWYGTNDQAAVTTLTRDQWRKSALNVLGGVCGLYPNATLITTSLGALSTGSTTAYNVANEGTRQVTQALGGVYVDITTAYTSAQTADGTHPNATAHLNVATAIKAAFGH